ncbi:MAG: hypothetical protein Tsb005_16520 [Gammaproteobacteria bacterium]
MIVLNSIAKSQKQLSEYIKNRRLTMGLTQAGLAQRAGVSLATLRKFEQKSVISLESFLKLLMVVDGLDNLLTTLTATKPEFSSIEDVLAENSKPIPKRGWRE